MKKLLLTLALCIFYTVAYAADGDITKAEVKPDVAVWKLDTVRFLVFTKTCEVTYRKVDSNGDPVGGSVTVIFMNVADDPDTPEDETSTEFTQLVTAINNGSNIKTTITNAVKIKLGI